MDPISQLDNVKVKKLVSAAVNQLQKLHLILPLAAGHITPSASENAVYVIAF